MIRALCKDAADGHWWVLEDSDQLIQTRATTPAEAAALVASLDGSVFSAGWVAYEAASGFNPMLKTHAPMPELPLAEFWQCGSPRKVAQLSDVTQSTLDGIANDWTPALNETQYQAAIQQIRHWLYEGHTYQVNFTFPIQQSLDADPLALFAYLVSQQDVPYASYFRADDYAIISISPELFFDKHGSTVRCKPMKGTMARGRSYQEDQQHANALHHSEKDRAENLMIVDMIRNDLGMIADLGSVKSSRVFGVESWPTVHQMTTEVSAQTNASLGDIFKALYPCASITGAPKKRTMEIITELEPEPRGVYCGALGFVYGDRAQFAVGIRTLTLQNAKARYCVGSGVTWQSSAEAEYEECLLKAQVLQRRRREFDLIETLRYEPEGGLIRLDAHLQRMTRSADYLGIEASASRLKQDAVNALSGRQYPARVRLRLSRVGEFSVETFDLPPTPDRWTVRCHPIPVDSRQWQLFHKTSDRHVYDDAKSQHPDVDEVLLSNERGELTEGCISNLVIEIGGQRLTPALDCGLLPGVMRQTLLEQGKLREALLLPNHLKQADAIWMINSLRGWIPVKLVD
ncbi:MAG: aminodeoxychorismate synthase component I [Gammaproteobacteria bacterium]|nr:aminodeoxychorismate synthase component I [Gammaproteobacteria bacterium]